jgi:two-component system, chemotaxis family, CheB/CheR fusion protein
MTERDPEPADRADGDLAPPGGYDVHPLVGLGGSAGSIAALRSFFERMPPDSGLAFVVVLHLSPEHESVLPEVLQHTTRMPVVQVTDAPRIQPNTVYVIPPRHGLKVTDGKLELDAPAARRGRHVAVDLFFRSLADTHGPHAAAVVLSGADGDGAIGIKRIKERGGLTVAQDPGEAEHAGMPRSSIATGMVDWVLPVAEIPQRLLDYFQLESKLKLPPEDGPQPTLAERSALSPDEVSLRDVLGFLRARTGRDFSCYKRATILRRVGRRMQVNGVPDLQQYLQCLRMRPGEAGALLQDLLISVTNFFRDSDCYEALDQELPAIMAGKGPNDSVRVWVAGCATGEEAYSIAMLLADHARAMDAPPMIQVFATDLDEEAVRAAREGMYPAVIEADVSEERLKRYFVREHRGYRVRRELRETVLFALHDLLKDSPFSRLDLVSCRNLLIYLNRDAQARVLETFHFALLPGGRLFLGASETVDDGSPLFTVVDKKHRLYKHRPASRPGLPLPVGAAALARTIESQHAWREGPVIAANALRGAAALAPPPEPPRSAPVGELHLGLLEMIASPSILVDAEYDIVHLSPSAGRFLQFAGGEPSRNLLRSVNPNLRIELRAALSKAAQSRALAEVAGVPVEIDGQQIALAIRVLPAEDMGAEMYLVVLQATAPGQAGEQPQLAQNDPIARHLDRELERAKSHLRDTVEQYEASTEELKASNEELQAMNEELRSATEELETSREELQSINEELTTVNHELKSKVDELAHSNSDLYNLMDATAIAIVFLDRELRITRFTPSAVSLFNLISSDVGRPLTDLKTQLQYPELVADATRVLERLVPIEREVGESEGRWYLSRLTAYRTVDDRIAGVVLAFIDITERKHAEETRLSLASVVTASSDAIISFALDGRILSWNRGAERVFERSAADAIGKPLAVLASEDGDGQAELIEKIASGQPLEDHEAVRKNKDGTLQHLAITVSPIRDENGQFLAGTALVRDVTAAKQASEALMTALGENERARAELQAADGAKDRFLAVLSHELRNPLASIGGAAEVMLSPGARESDLREAAHIVQRQSQGMKAMLEDLLDVSRLRFGRLGLRHERVLLSQIVASALEVTRPLLAGAGHSLEMDLPHNDIELPGDALRLGQVLSNLLANAIRYTPRGGMLKVRARLAADRLELSVIDNGAGMEPQRIQSMFQMFTQGEGAAGGAQGLGIGLALVKSLVELHGGSVSALSDGPGRGSEFRVVLPNARVAATAAPAPSVTAQPQQPAAHATKRRKVLVADDNRDAGWGMARLLELAGFETLQADGGAEALTVLAQRRPDAAVIDVGMPDIDGHEVARKVRAANWGARMVLVAATGFGQDSDAKAALAAGFDAHVTKPVDVRELAILLDSLFTQRRG